MKKKSTSSAAGGTKMSKGAQEALWMTGFSRRDFLKGSGALIVTFSVTGVTRAQPRGSRPSRGPSPDRVDSWIAVGEDGRVTAYAGKCELGHGLYTAQTQLVAEELVVPIDRVTLVYCDTAITPDQGTTSGSQSHPENFNRTNLAQAAATAREALFRLASERLSVPADRLTVRDGVIAVKGEPDRRVGYGELVGGRRFNIPLDENARRRSRSEWTVLGMPVRRLEIPDMVAGTFEYVHNVRVPRMLHGQVVRPPAAGANFVSVDEGSVRGLPGFVKVVVKKNFVGVVAEKPWQAIQAARRLKVQWTPGTGLPNHARFYDHMRNERPRRDSVVVDSKDVDAALGRAAQVVRATYYHPYQAHGSVGTSCAVADVQGDRATIWSATQASYPLRNSVALILGLSPDRVRVVFTLGSGCYGLNGADTVSYDAALLSQAVGRPVRVQLTRRDEMTWDNYGTAAVIDERVALDVDANIMAWDYEGWFPTLGGRPGYETPGNVITGLLVGFDPVALTLPQEVPQARTPGSPAPEQTGPFRNRRNEAPNYVAGCVGGECGGTGTVESERVLSHSVASPFFTGPLRSPWRLQNTFAHESFMDELAARAKADPVAYRLHHLRDPRLREVVTAVAKAANWQARPSPKGASGRTGIAAGRGIACVLYEGDNGYSAMVAEVEVNQDTGAVALKRLVVSIDCGPISNPDGLRNQVEGGALHGACRAFLEEVTWDDTKVTSVDWRRYSTWSLGSDIPSVECVLIDRPEAEACGAGETSITVAAAAIGNAFFDATGARLREVPFTPQRVKAALAARE